MSVFAFFLMLLPSSLLWNDGSCTGLCAAMEANYSTEVVPGGSGQNTARVVQWLLGVPRCTTVLACIGADSAGRELARYVNCDADRNHSVSQPSGNSTLLSVISLKVKGQGQGHRKSLTSRLLHNTYP